MAVEMKMSFPPMFHPTKLNSRDLRIGRAVTKEQLEEEKGVVEEELAEIEQKEEGSKEESGKEETESWTELGEALGLDKEES